MSNLTLAASRPRTIPLQQVADDTGLSLNAVKRAINADTTDQLPDDIRRIPGGRVEGASYYVIARQYERIIGPIDVQPVTAIHTRKTG